MRWLSHPASGMEKIEQQTASRSKSTPRLSIGGHRLCESFPSVDLWLHPWCGSMPKMGPAGDQRVRLAPMATTCPCHIWIRYLDHRQRTMSRALNGTLVQEGVFIVFLMFKHKRSGKEEEYIVFLLHDQLILSRSLLWAGTSGGKYWKRSHIRWKISRRITPQAQV